MSPHLESTGRLEAKRKSTLGPKHTYAKAIF